MAPQFHIGIKNNVTADAGDGVCELHFLGRIENKESFDWFGGSTEQNLLQEVIDQVNAAKPKKIVQHIDSWGGDADLGQGIYNFLKSYPSKVETKIVNKAASAATCMACAGSKITMPKNGFYVIHQAQNVAHGTSKDLRAAADVADKYTAAYCDIYAQNNRKGMTSEEIMALIADGDYWMSGEQAKEMGFVDDCYNDESVTVTACIEDAKAIYGDKIPQHILQMAAQPATAEDKTFYTKILDEMKSFKEMVTAALSGKKVTAKVGDNMEADITSAITPIFAEMAAEMEEAVTAEIGGIKEAITADVTAKMEESYGAKLTEQAETITALKTSIETITADLTKIAGKQSPAAGATADVETGKKTLTGRFAGE